MRYLVTLYIEDSYNFETHQYELGRGKEFEFYDYDDVESFIGHMINGSRHVMIGIQKGDDDE